MCEECGEAPVQFVAYFNKPGGKYWRPPQRAAAPSSSPLAGEGRGGGPLPKAPTRGEVPSAAFACEETRAE
jgi:hypothetical protein